MMSAVQQSRDKAMEQTLSCQTQNHLSSLALRTLATSNTLQNHSPKTNRCVRVSSPLTNLALNLSELTTRSTPHRQLSLSSSSIDTLNASQPTTEHSESIELGCFVDSPSSPLQSPTLLEMRRKTVAFRRFSELVPVVKPSPAELANQCHTVNQDTLSWPTNRTNIVVDTCNIEMNTSTVTSWVNSTAETGARNDKSLHYCSSEHGFFSREDSNSQDSGLGCDKDTDDGFLFTAPKGLPLRRNSKMINEDTCSPFKYSPVKQRSPSKHRNSCTAESLDFSSVFVKKIHDEEGISSPLKLFRLTSLDEGIDDDGFFDLMDAEVAALTSSAETVITGSKTMSNLFNAPIVNNGLHVSGQDDTPVTRKTICKRNIHCIAEKPHGLTCKHHQSDNESPFLCSFKHGPQPQELAFKRDQSESPFLCSCKRDPPQDESTPIQALKRHRPMPAVEMPTAGALNIYTTDQIMDEFLKSPIHPKNPDKRIVLIFHCEFSSERGPKLSRFLRSQDRKTNKDCYPYLHYPELYLLDGGYKAYFATEKHQCMPQEYKPMLHKDHTADLRHFRTKSKSWAGEQRGTGPGLRTLKF